MFPSLGRKLRGKKKKKTANVLIQFLTLRKLCWLVRSNISRNPMASLKNAVVRLRNLEHTGKNDFSMKHESDPLLPARLRSQHCVSLF